MAEAKRYKNVSAVKLALLARQMREQTENIEFLKSEPIAVVGMGCRLPAGANDPAKFWELLTSGRDAITEIPADRWNIDELYDPEYGTTGKMNSRWGGFVDQLDSFDPEFFGITPREALQMDPQQRMLMEVAYESLESAGLPRENLSGSSVGVFVASSNFDYSHRVLSDLNEIDAYGITGNFHCFLANRLSFLFNFRGPSLALDTACSSSLVAVHLAVRALRNRDCDLALAGGVNTLIAPETMVALSNWGMLSPDGSCKTFDSGANGFVRAEGCGVIVLKRLADALAENDTVLAVIRGTAVNQDGRSTVITAPNGMAQRAVLKQALADALVEPEQISAIEAHGTGTILGDPIEVEALTDVIGQPRPEGDICFLSSVKTNIGHLEAAAGIAGIIKTILCFQHGAVPPHLHFKELNPHISLKNVPFVIPTENQPWNPASGRRFAGVSSFGFGGTNAHVVMEEAPQLPARPAADEERMTLLPLSAHHPQALRDMASAYSNYLATSPKSLQDIGYTTSLRRSHLDYRLAVAGRSAEELAERLSALVNSSWQPTAVPHDKPKLAFVFSGQGPQWWAMGRQLLETESVFRESIEQIDALLRPYTDWSLLDELLRDEAQSRLDETEIAQPALFALQVALSSLWNSWGVTPGAVVGHSIGELAAAYVAGVLSLEDAVRVVYHRARLMQQATGTGKMASVEISAATAADLIAPYGNRLSIAAVNSPTTTVLSGEPDALQEVLSKLEAEGVSHRMLRVNYAFHSAQMEPYARELSTTLRGLNPKTASLPIYSTVTGHHQEGKAFDAAYWGQNVRQTVQLASAIHQLANDGYTTFLEISPHPVLSGMIMQCLQAADQAGVAVASLRRNRDEQESMFQAMGELYSAGYPVAWKQFYPSGGRVVSDLPTYAWQRERYWVDLPQRVTVVRAAGEHPLLGQKVKSPFVQGTLYTAQITPHTPPFLNDHRIWGMAVVPAAAYLEAAVSATANGEQAVELKNVFVQEALILPDDNPRSIQLHLSADQSEFKLYSLSGEDHWTQHVGGEVRRIPANHVAGSASFSAQEIQGRCRPFNVQEHYDLVFENGIQFGPAFQGIEQMWRRDGEALASIQLPQALLADASQYLIYPPLLDACIQTMAGSLPGYDDHFDTWLPIYFESFRFYARPSGVVWSHAQLSGDINAGTDVVTGDIQIVDATGQLIAEIGGVRLKRTNQEALRRIVNKQSSEPLTELFYEVNWQPAPPAEPVQAAGSWLIFADQSGIGEALAGQLAAHNEQYRLILPGAEYQVLNDITVLINPEDPSDYQRLMWDVVASGDYRGILHLWGLDTPSLEQADISPVAAQFVGCGTTLYLLQALAEANLPQMPELWLMTREAQPVNGQPPIAPEQASLWGLANTIAVEHPDLRCVCVDLGATPSVEQIVQNLQSTDIEDRLALRDSQRFVPRLVRSEISTQTPLDDQPVTLTITERGVLDNLVQQPITRTAPVQGEVEVRVHTSGLNFRDVLNALGMYPGDPGPLGDEFVGEIVRIGEGVTDYQPGDVVLGMTSGSHSTYVNAPVTKIVHKPSGMTDEEAATIPITFMTAYYALNYLADMSAGDRVLIHAGAGGVGMAAVQLAQRVGAEIFATAGSPEKREFLRTLGVQHVMDSRSLDFADEIMKITNGAGVTHVLNSLTGDFITKSMSVLADNGHFLEIGKTGIWTHEEVAQFNPTLHYEVIYLGDTLREEPLLGQQMFHDLMELFAQGELRPLPHRVFPITDVVSAFRFMAQAKHIGKIVLRHAGDNAVHIRPDATYLITGGLSGIGLHTAGWLAEQGARHLVLTGRRAPGEAALVSIQAMEEAGAQVMVAQSDVGLEADVTALLTDIRQTMPPLHGIIHAAGVLDDGILLQQDWSRFANVLNPKLNGAWNLSQHAPDFPLDFLIFFSAGAALLGSAGQGNYTAANALLDSLVYTCRAQGVPAFSINWGAWENTGMTAGLNTLDRWAKEGIDALTPQRGLEALAWTLHNQHAAQIAILPMRWADFAHSSRMRPFFSTVVEKEKPQTVSAAPELQEQSDLLRRWQETVPNRRPRLLMDTIREEVIHVLGLRPTTSIDPRQPLNELGLDSLMAVELRNTLIKLLDTSLPATLLFDYPTSEALVNYLMKHVPALAQSEDTAADKSTAQQGQNEASAALQQMTDEEAEALLLAELDQLSKGENDG